MPRVCPELAAVPDAVWLPWLANAVCILHLAGGVLTADLLCAVRCRLPSGGQKEEEKEQKAVKRREKATQQQTQ